MKKRDELRSLQSVVMDVLMERADARNSDDILYLAVCNRISGENKLTDINAYTFITQRKELGFPPFESVSRVRRKVQQELPELSSDTDTSIHRQILEQEFRDYAREGEMTYRRA